ncbi:MAG: TonB-dependent receptor [Xanthomonadales bacterium]|nr:TonB-dependent receptor [Xanthomonadales bacterium]
MNIGVKSLIRNKCLDINNGLPILPLIALTLVTPFVSAQELEEVIVTAQRRVQDLQDVPISITAFSAAEIKLRGVNETKEYFMFTPNVSFTEDGEAGQRSVGISIRGVSDFANALTDIGGLSNSFGIYLDEFNVANSANKVANPQLQDLQSIEVLRGPQGTFFGRNATGGALNLTTNLPDDTNYYELYAGYSSFNTLATSLVGNIPVTDTLFVRGVVWYEESDGFIKNLSPTGNDASYDQNNVRASVRWLASDHFTVDASWMHSKENDGTDTNVNSGVLDADTIGSIPNLLALVPINTYALEPSPRPPIPADFRDRAHGPISDFLPVDSGEGFFPNNRRYINKDFYESNIGSSDLFNLRLNYAVGNWSIRSITGYLDSEAQREFDQDLTQYGLYETYAGRHSETFSQEVRFNWANDTWDITTGALYADDSTLDFGQSPIGPDGFAIGSLNPDGTIANCGFCLNPGQLIGGKGATTLDVTSYALYTDVLWMLNENWSLTGGVRFTQDNLTFTDYNRYEALTFAQVRAGTVPPNSDIDSRDERDFTDVSPRFVVSYLPNEDVTTYFLISAGYKPGGSVLQTDTRYEEERLWNYEAGLKMKALNNRLSLNAAIFTMDWQGMQIPTLDTELIDGQIFLNTEILNVDASSSGAELEIQALPSEDWFFSAGIGYLHAKFDGFGDDDPYIFEGMAFDLDGETLPRSPEWTLNAVGQYNFNLSDQYDAFLRVEWAYRSETFSDVEAIASVSNPLDIPGFGNSVSGSGITILYPRDDFPFRVPGFDVFNLRAGIDGPRWGVVGYVENLLDDNYYTGTQENFGLGGIRIRPHHRVVGVQFRFFTE